MDEEKNNVKEEPPKVNLTGIFFLLILIFICNGYICLSIIRQTNSNNGIDSTHRVLLLTMEDNISSKDASDDIQVNNALKNGGTVRVKDSNEGYQKAFGYEYERYGAINSSGTYWTKGAVLNYIASRGWTLIQAPSTGLTDMYYFVK
ncbi:MAG: hypothetical protein IJQ86_04680 [Spirochaetia bacterium]|nr:hypothetical protein [Spirochaetia bacterium]